MKRDGEVELAVTIRLGSGLGIVLGSGLNPGSGVKLDAGSDREGGGSGSDLHHGTHGTHRATNVTTSKKTGERPFGLYRRRALQKLNE